MIRNNSAFTLTEMMVVISIIVVLAAGAVTGLVLWLPKYKLNSAASELQAMIQAARLRAVKDNARVVILFDPNADGNLESDYVAFVDDEAGGAGEWTFDPASEILVKSGHLPVGVRFENTTFAGNRLRLNSRGILDGINGSVNLKNSRNATKSITVYVSGNSRVH